MSDITSIFIGSLKSVQNVIMRDKHCFEMYGYDIMLDSKLKPWLLEVNASPSLTPSSKEDYDMKFRVLNHLLDIIDMEGIRNNKDITVGGFDLFWDDGPVYARDTSNLDLAECFQPRLNANLGKFRTLLICKNVSIFLHMDAKVTHFIHKSKIFRLYLCWNGNLTTFKPFYLYAREINK